MKYRVPNLLLLCLCLLFGVGCLVVAEGSKNVEFALNDDALLIVFVRQLLHVNGVAILAINGDGIASTGIDEDLDHGEPWHLCVVKWLEPKWLRMMMMMAMALKMDVRSER